MAEWNRNKRFHGKGIIYEREGLLACDYRTSNAHVVEVHYNYNGSGGDAFGGADEWPVVTCKIGFQEGQEAEADALAEKIRNLIDAEVQA